MIVRVSSPKEALAWTKISLRSNNPYLLIQRRYLEPSHDPGCPLTDRELQIICLVALGLTNAEVARELYLKPSTVKSHLARISKAIKVGDRAGMVTLCYRMGWID